MNDPLALETRIGLPEPLRVLAEALPREGWDTHPNFDELTRFWLSRHMMFRETMARLQSGSQSFLGGGRDLQAHARETSHYAGFLLNQLHGHHMIEDAHYFPTLTKLDGRLDYGFALLDRDHKALDGHIHALASTTNTFLQRVAEHDVRDRAADLGTALDAFSVFLHRHLEDEEDLVVPVILTYAPTF